MKQKISYFTVLLGLLCCHTTIIASTIVADHDITVDAGHNLNILAGTNNAHTETQQIEAEIGIKATVSTNIIGALESLGEMMIMLQQVKALIMQQRAILPCIGMVKLYYMLRDKIKALGMILGRDKFVALCQRLRLQQPRKPRRKTGDTMLHFVAPNLLKNVEPLRPNLIWYTDITYLKFNQMHVYLSLIIDHCSRKIIAWHIADNMKATESVKALNMAIAQVQPEQLEHIIHHSDRGSQYTSQQYRDALDKHHITQSMTDGGKPYQNAINERLNGILKHEFNLKQSFTNWTEMNQIIYNAINLYNNVRPHTALKYKTPAQIYQQKLG